MLAGLPPQDSYQVANLQSQPSLGSLAGTHLRGHIVPFLAFLPTLGRLVSEDPDSAVHIGEFQCVFRVSAMFRLAQTHTVPVLEIFVGSTVAHVRHLTHLRILSNG